MNQLAANQRKPKGSPCDIRGFLGMSEDVRKGYQAIRINMRVKSEATAEQLKELALFSPVYDVVSNSLPVALNTETYS